MDRPNDSERQERIEAFVSGRLGGEELRVFEQAMAADDELRADVEIERVTRETLKREPEMRFRDLVRRVSEEQENAGQDTGTPEIPVIPIDRKRNWTWMAAAASIALVLTVGIAQWLRGPDDQELALAFANQSVPTTRGDDAPTPYSGVAELDSALAHILAQQPDRAIGLLTAYSTSDPALSCKRDWLNALALLQHGDEEHALALLDRVIGGACHPEPGLAKELKGKF